MTILEADICVIGGGSGGLSVAAGASQMGAKVVLFERDKMGGDCLNYGCVPSKALLAAAKLAHSDPRAEAMGITATKAVNMVAVKAHIDDVIAGIAPHDSVERFRDLGVKVIESEARFIDHRSVSGGGYTVKAKYFVIATGSSPFVPPVEGLSDTPYYTNETIFSLTKVPDHLIIMGGGPIGIEMAQAWRRLGAKVTVVEAASIMNRDEPRLVEILQQHLTNEGITFIEGTAISKASGKNGQITVTLSGKTEATLHGSHILVAVGRRPNLDGLDLDQAGISYGKTGITTNSRLKTSNRRVFAIGDVSGRQQFTHIAGYHAGIVIQNMLFRLPAKVSDNDVPWVTYTDPELAHVGMTMDMAKAAGYNPIQLIFPLAENDRARAEKRTEGMVIAVTTKKGKILGASILAPHAGEMIGTWSIAIKAKAKIKTMASYIAPYPTYGEASKRAGVAFYTPKLFSPRVQRLVRFLLKWF